MLKIDVLKDILEKSNDRFFNGDNPLMNDEMYDYIKDYVLTLDPNYKQFVGYKVKGKKIKLPIWMGSMDKKKGGIDVSNVIITNKLDGVSCLLVKKAKKYTMYTRGDGTHGQDITNLMKYLNVQTDNELDSYMIRGELVLSNHNFSKLKMNASNPRNTVSGFVNSKTPNEELINKIDFVGYEVIEPKSMTPYDQLMYMQHNGFTPVPFGNFKNINDTQLLELFSRRKKESLYDIDGLVVAKNEVYLPVKKGNPKHAFAYKPSYENVENKVTTVIEVIWKISKDGYYKPTVTFEQIDINNVKITKASGFNGEFIYKNKIGKNAKINVIRSGDVIPHITKVITGTVADMPKGKYKWSESGKDIIVDTNVSTGKEGASVSNKSVVNELLKSQFEYMLTKLNIEFLGKGTINKLYENDITTIKALYDVKVEKLKEIKGFGDQKSKNIIDAVKKRRTELTCIDYMVASNMFGRGFGQTRFEMIILEFPPSNVKIPSTIEISNIDGLGDKLAAQYITGLIKFRSFMSENNIKCTVGEVAPKESNLFSNKKIILTGFRDDAIINFIKANNGKLSKSVSNDLYMIIHNQIPSKKPSKTYDFGVQNNITLMSKNDFLKKYME